MTTEEVAVLRHSACSLAFNLPPGLSLDESDEPIRVSVTHNDEPVDNFSMTTNEDERKSVVQKVFDNIDSGDGGNYVITVDIGRQQFVHKLAVAVCKFLIYFKWLPFFSLYNFLVLKNLLFLLKRQMKMF